MELAPTKAQAMSEVFREIDRVQALAGSVVAHLTTESGRELELHVGPGRACFAEDGHWCDYELVVPSDYEPPSWLRRFATGEVTVFGMVPRTMLTHLADRLGGLARAVVEPCQSSAQLHLMVTVPAARAEETARALRRTIEAHLPAAVPRISMVHLGEVTPK